MTDALQWKKPCLPCSEPKMAVAKARWPGWGVRISGGGYSRGQKAGELLQATLRPPGRNGHWPRRPTCSTAQNPARHSQRKRGAARASGEVRLRPPPRRFAAPGPLPASLRRAGSGTELHLPGSATRAAVQPAETTSQPGRRPGSTGAKGRSGTGRREAPRRLDSASQVSVRRRLCGLHLGKLWFACRLPGGRGRRKGRAAQAQGLRAPRRVYLGHRAGISRALTLRAPAPTEAAGAQGPFHRPCPAEPGALAEPALAKPALAPLQSPPVLGGGSAKAARGSDPAGERVSRPSRPCSAGGSDEGSRRPQGYLRGFRRGPRGRGVGAAAGTARSPARARGSKGQTWARLRRCLRPPGCGRCGPGAGRGLAGAAEPFAVAVLTNASRTGAGRRAPSLLGPYSFGTRTPGPLVGEPGSGCACPQQRGNGFSSRACCFPEGGRVPRAGGAGTAPQRLWSEPLLVDGHRLSLPAVPWLGAGRRSTPPHRCPDAVAHSHLPVPFSDSSSGSLPPGSPGKTEATTPFRRPRGL